MNGVGNWLLRHTVLIVFLLFLIVGLIFRDQIFAVDAVQIPIEETLESPVGDAPVEKAPQPHPITEYERQDETRTVTESADHKAGETEDTQSPTRVAEVSGADMNDAGAGDMDVTAPPGVAGLSPLEEDAKGLEYRPMEPDRDRHSTVDSLSARNDYLGEARSAYWGGDEERAIEIYRSLLAFYPNDPDVHGELGNIFLKRGDKDSAFDQYREAVRVFRESDRLEYALEFVRQVSVYDQEMGERLHLLLGPPDRSN